jgi:hypothetical protein
MKVLKRAKAFEVRLYMGARRGYGEEQYPADKVIRAISEFQAGTEDDEPPIPVRLTSTTFVSKDYVEEGWEIAVVRYPLPCGQRCPPTLRPGTLPATSFDCHRRRQRMSAGVGLLGRRSRKHDLRSQSEAPSDQADIWDFLVRQLRAGVNAAK